jgi:RND family efflux transporter MFP subunit
MKNTFSQHWLEILCSTIAEANSALLTVYTDQEEIETLAQWPANNDQERGFTPIVKFALKKQRQVCIPNIADHDTTPFDFFALPVYKEAKLIAVIAVKTDHCLPTRHEAIFNSIQQSSQWLRLTSLEHNQTNTFYTQVVALLASCFEQNNYQQGLVQLVTEFSHKFNCDRVAFAEYKDKFCHVIALSNTADFDKRSNFLQKIASTMEEAIDQDTAQIFPNTDTPLVQHAHTALAKKSNSGSLCTIPLIYQQKILGAITLFRSKEEPFDKETLDICQQTLSLISPYLAIKQSEEKSLSHKLWAKGKQNLQGLFGLKYLKTKLTAILITLFLLLSSQIESDFRVTSDAILEGKIQRVIAAPIAGYLLSATVQAGDTVKQGDVMATLDDAELQLKLTQLRGQQQQARREYRKAVSTRDLVEVSVITAKINQATAEINLTLQQLKNIQLTAPFDGAVIEGDLSQMLGSPVERGDTLFKIAPLEGYRIILKVNERLISYVKKGQGGLLTLTSMPGQQFPLQIEKITAIANVKDGANIFRVEASLNDTTALFRPGMEGVAKIQAGRSNLLWIWTHEMRDWLRLKLWTWWF